MESLVIIGIGLTFIAGAIAGYVLKMVLDKAFDVDMSRPHDDYD